MVPAHSYNPLTDGFACLRRYNQALWNSVMTYDAQTMAPVLASHSYQGMPLLGLVDPAPVALMGRHVAFKLAGSGIMHVRGLPDVPCLLSRGYSVLT